MNTFTFAWLGIHRRWKNFLFWIAINSIDKITNNNQHLFSRSTSDSHSISPPPCTSWLSPCIRIVESTDLISSSSVNRLMRHKQKKVERNEASSADGRRTEAAKINAGVLRNISDEYCWISVSIIINPRICKGRVGIGRGKGRKWNGFLTRLLEDYSELNVEIIFRLLQRLVSLALPEIFNYCKI